MRTVEITDKDVERHKAKMLKKGIKPVFPWKDVYGGTIPAITEDEAQWRQKCGQGTIARQHGYCGEDILLTPSVPPRAYWLAYILPHEGGKA